MTGRRPNIDFWKLACKLFSPFWFSTDSSCFSCPLTSALALCEHHALLEFQLAVPPSGHFHNSLSGTHSLALPLSSVYNQVLHTFCPFLWLFKARSSTSWNQDCWEKYQSPQICRWHHPYGRKRRRNKEPLDESERGEWKSYLKLNIQKTKITASGPVTSWQIDGGAVETVADFILGGLQNHCRWWLQPWH